MIYLVLVCEKYHWLFMKRVWQGEMTTWLLQDPDAELLTLLSLPDLNQVKNADASVKNHHNVGAQKVRLKISLTLRYLDGSIIL